jgi:hypothetical protein
LNDRIYIHEFIDIRGHNRSTYMHHMTANWSPTAQAQRHQLCYGVWAVLGSTGPWPQVVNLWEEDGWEGLGRSFGTEAVGTGAQDPKLERWWETASEFRRGGFDRIMLPAPWTNTIEELCADGVTGVAYAHELVRVRPGSARELLERAREVGSAALAHYGWKLVGAFTTAMVNDDEALLIWAIPSWEQWAQAEAAHRSDDAVVRWRTGVTDQVTGWHRTLLVDAPLSPFRTHRQPAVEDRTDWVE